MFLKKDDNITDIKQDLKQDFENRFTLNIGQKEIIKMKNNEVITDRDLNISKFLFKFRFATFNQIYSYLKNVLADGEKMSSEISIKNRLNKLVQYRIINRFILRESSFTDETPEALNIYCLDLGGRYLLAHYSNVDVTDWYTTINMKDSGIINKNLCVTEFYLSLMKSCPDKVTYLNIEPDIRVGKRNVIPSFDMCINISGNNSYFVGEVVRDFDFPVVFREKILKLESLLVSNAWKKYYYDSLTPPVLFLLVDTDKIAFELSKLILETTKIRRFRLTTDKRMKKMLYETGAFLRYVKNKGALQEITATTFTP